MLSLTERQENVRGAFKATDPKSLSGRHVLIVDDVLTSGATINEVARQLSGCRTQDISALVVARATGW
jgi:predicted amidophosphoribosyltransferase